MAALAAAAAMAAITIEPEKRSPMTISLCLAVRVLHRNLPLVYRGSVCGEKMVLPDVHGRLLSDDFTYRNAAICRKLRACRTRQSRDPAPRLLQRTVAITGGTTNRFGETVGGWNYRGQFFFTMRLVFFAVVFF
jgi:hypothetical protein